MTDRFAALKQDVETAVSITKSGNGDERKIVINVRPEKKIKTLARMDRHSQRVRQHRRGEEPSDSSNRF